MEKQIDKHTFFKQSIGVAESMEITLWTNVSLETRILAKMKIENRGKIFFPWKTNSQAYFVF